jgi:hypothetical protein
MPDFTNYPLSLPPSGEPILVFQNYTLEGTSTLRADTPQQLREKIMWLTFINLSGFGLQVVGVFTDILNTPFINIPAYTVMTLPIDTQFRDGIFVYYTDPVATGSQGKLTIIWSDRNLGYQNIGGFGAGGGAISTNATISSPLTSGASSVSTTDWLTDVGRGTTFASSVYIRGNASTTASFTTRNLLNDLTAGAITTSFLTTTGQQVQLISTSANDTSAGTGARTVKIYYLDSTFTPQTETITLNGTTAVNSISTNYAYFIKAVVLTSGTGGTAAGNITLQNVGGTLFYARILTGYTQTQSGQYTVPLGKTLYISAVNVGCGGVAYSYMLEGNVDPATNTLLANNLQLYFNNVNAPVFIELPIPIKIVSGATILVKAQSATASAPIVELFGWIE